MLGIQKRSLVIFFVIVGLFGTFCAAFATFVNAPRITCSTANASHAGFNVSVSSIDHDRYQGELAANAMTPQKPFDESEFTVERDPDSPAGRCGLRVTKRDGDKSRAFKLRIWPGSQAEGYEGELDLNYRGQPIHPDFRKVNCYVEQYVFERYCPVSRNGGVFEGGKTVEQGGASKGGPGNATGPKVIAPAN